MKKNIAPWPSISVVIPVFHEGETVNRAVGRIKKQVYPGHIEIIVVDGDTQGSTLRHIDYPDVVRLTASPGRANQMNAGAGRARGRLLVFLHCDTQLPADGFACIFNILVTRRCDIGAFDLRIDAEGFGFRMIEKTASLRSRLTRIPYGDQVFFMERDFFMTMGQFRQMPLMEDVEFMQRVKKKGGRLFICSKGVKTSARRWQKEGKIYGTLRNWVVMALYLLGVPPETLVRYYKTDRDA